jgi:hypothetical protein
MMPENEKLKLVVEVWKKVVDVQQHFNDLALRIRSFALTTFTFIIGASGYLLKEKISVNFGSKSAPASSLVCFTGILILAAFWFMDRYWYHNLLVGAVTHGSTIENKYRRKFEELGLATSISSTSPTKILGRKIHSKHKFWIFYGIMWVTLLAWGISLLFIDNVKKPPQKTETPPSLQVQVNYKSNFSNNSSSSK